MKLVGNHVLATAALISVAALILSIYPGLLNDVMSFVVFLTFVSILTASPVIGGAIAFIIAGAIWSAANGTLHVNLQKMVRPISVSKSTYARFVIAGMVVTTTIALLALAVPRRIAFATARPSLEHFVSHPPKVDTGFERRAGVYTIDKYAADPRGGAFFRVHVGWMDFGPDITSYGFVYRPNRAGTPFGAAQYRLHPIGDGWYEFSVSNDWD